MVAEGVRMITELGEGCWQVHCRGVNAYLVDDDGVLTMVDTGTPVDTGRLRDGLEQLSFEMSQVERILLTHFDIDHVGNVATVLAESGATCYVGAGDGGFLMGRERPPLLNRKGLFQRLTAPFVDAVTEQIEFVADRDRIGSFVAHHTPGHTPGHLSFVSEELGVAFVGDLVREHAGSIEPSPWLLSYDTSMVTSSIVRLADREPRVETVAMGHGAPFTEGGSRQLADLSERVDGQLGA